MTPKYKPGSSNFVSDSLSRAPLSSGQVTEQDSVVLQLTENTQSGMELVQQQQRQDPDLAKLIDYLRDGTLPENYSEAQWIMVQGNKKGYHVVDDILYYKSVETPSSCS